MDDDYPLVGLPPKAALSANASAGSLKRYTSFSAHHGSAVAPGALAHSESWRIAEPLETSPQTHQTRKVLFVAMAFAIIFAAFNVAQTFLTPLFPTYGFYSFAVLYLLFAIGSIFAPNIGHSIGLVPSLVLGGVTFVLFILAFEPRNGPCLLLVRSRDYSAW